MMQLGISILIAVLAVGASGVNAQVASPLDRDRAIALAQGDHFAEAIPLLAAIVKQNKKDVRAWHWLGTALEKQGNIKDAVKAHEQAAKTADQLQSAAMNDLSSLSKMELLEAADSAERYLVLKTPLSDKKRKEWRDRSELLRLQAANYPPDPTIYKHDDVTTLARVLRKPEPTYTDEARKNLVTGTVVLRCVFGADGRVRHISVVRGLPDGLTDRALYAAREIKFIPATKDGKPVSMWMQLEYNFLLF